MTSTAVAIIGGGISGLAAAYELHQAGVPFLLYERARSLGGVIRTERVAGYTIDAGPDALLTQKPAAIELCRALGLASRLRPQAARATYVVRGERLRQLPEASVFGVPTKWWPFVRSDALPFTGRLRMAADLWLPSIPAAAVSDESIASFIRRRFGSDAVDYLAEPLLAGIHGGDPEQLSMHCAFPRLAELETRHRSVILGLQREAARRPRPTGAAPPPFVALTGGMSELVDALAASVPSDAVRRGVGVERIGMRAGRYDVCLGDGTHTDASAVILATPPPATASLAAAVSPGLQILCDEIRMAPSVTMALGYKRSAVAHPLNGAGFVTPSCEGMIVRAVTWVSSKWPGRAPADAVLLRAFLGGALHPDVIDVDDDTLIEHATRDCAALLGISGAPDLIRIYRWPDATPQLTVGHGERMAEIERRLSAQPGLFVSASGFRGTGIADCVADARRQAARAAAFIASRDDVVRWRARPA